MFMETTLPLLMRVKLRERGSEEIVDDFIQSGVNETVVECGKRTPNTVNVALYRYLQRHPSLSVKVRKIGDTVYLMRITDEK